MTIPDFFPFVLYFACAFYCLTLLFLLYGITRSRQAHTIPTPTVSVIVAARNEEHHIRALLDCLMNQSYPEYEIIIVDDRSEDRTDEIVKSAQSGNKQVTLLSIKAPNPDMPSKKNALMAGIKAAKGVILLFTDADCRPPSNWISRLVQAFDDNVGLVAGYSPYDAKMLSGESPAESPGLFQAFIRYEELKAALWSWGAIGVGKAWLCTGRSLAYRKTVWEEVGGFGNIRHSVSGDDDLFLQLVRRSTSWEIRYVSAKDSHVPTKPPRTVGQFLEQRKRHFSAAKYFPLTMKVFFAVFHGSNVLLYCGFIASVFGCSAGLWLFLVKSFFDFVFIWLGSRRLGSSAPIFSFFVMEVVYVLYNALMGPLGLFGSFKWKTQTT